MNTYKHEQAHEQAIEAQPATAEDLDLLWTFDHYFATYLVARGCPLAATIPGRRLRFGFRLTPSGSTPHDLEQDYYLGEGLAPVVQVIHAYQGISKRISANKRRQATELAQMAEMEASR